MMLFGTNQSALISASTGNIYPSTLRPRGLTDETRRSSRFPLILRDGYRSSGHAHLESVPTGLTTGSREMGRLWEYEDDGSASKQASVQADRGG